jgi:Flp pilus assembly protein TadG
MTKPTGTAGEGALRGAMKRPPRKGERGIALIAIGIAIFAFFALMVIAVDVGRFSHTASEVQSVADLAALSGAKSVQVKGSGQGYGQEGANTAALQNTFDGRTFVNNSSVASLNAEEGCFTPPDPACSSDCRGTFTPGGIACSSGQFAAVRATATGHAVKVVTANLIPGTPSQEDITRSATAVIAGHNGVQATLPVTLCPALLTALQPNQQCVQDAPLKAVLFAPDGSQNSCYSNLGLSGGASGSDFRSLLPPECSGITTGDRPVVSIGEQIQTQNGTTDTFLHALQDCVRGGTSTNPYGVHDFVLPVTDCGACNQARTVLDFVTIHIATWQQVVDTGSAGNCYPVDPTRTTLCKGIHDVTQVCDNTSSGGGGSLVGGAYGNKQVLLGQ